MRDGDTAACGGVASAAVAVLAPSLVLGKGGVDGLAAARQQCGCSAAAKVTGGARQRQRLALVPSVPAAVATAAALVPAEVTAVAAALVAPANLQELGVAGSVRAAAEDSPTNTPWDPTPGAATGGRRL